MIREIAENEQSKCQSIFEKMIDGFAYHKIIMDHGIPVDYLYLDVNPAFEQLFGLTKNEIIGKKATELIPDIKQDRFDWIGVYGKTAITGEPIRFTLFSEAFDKWLLVSAYGCERGYFAVIFQDITPQKRYEDELIQSIASAKHAEEIATDRSKEYEMIFNGTQDMMFVVAVEDGDVFRYRRLNRSHELLSGLTTQEVYQKTPQQVFGLGLGKQIIAHFQECVQKKEPIIFEERLSFPSKTGIWSTMLSPVMQSERVVQIIGSRRDITAQQIALENLKESEQRYSSLFENNHSVVLIIEPNKGDIIDANPAACAYYGYSLETIRTLNVKNINILPGAEIQNQMALAVSKGQRHFYFQHQLSNGEIRDVEVYSGPLTIAGKQLLYSIVHDITARKKAEMELFAEKERLDVTLHSIGDGVITTDIEGRVTLLNEIAQGLTGWNFAEALGKPMQEVFCIINEKTRKKCQNPVEKVLKTGNVVRLANHTALIAKDGTERCIEDSGAPIKDKNGNIFGVVLVFRDITAKKMQDEEIKYLSFHDKLTGLYNRAFFEKEMKRLDREKYLPLSIIIGDVNGLKLTNDIFGHAVGDKLLQTISAILTETCKKDNIIARWGGDEFVIILPATAYGKALSTGRKIEKKCISQPKEPIQPSIALGIATKKDIFQDLNAVLKDAEDKMYRSKLLEGKSVRNSLLASLEKTLYERSYETEEHAKRILGLAEKVGREIGLSGNELDELSLLAILHDIGKIGIPDSILMKPDRLTPEEWQEMQKHPEIGCRIAQSTPELSYIADLILAHHERWDGTGYPVGLKGTEIPRLARILSIIDAYDVMTHARPYKGAISSDEAIREIMNCSGRQFDPVLAEVFIKVLGFGNSANENN